MNKDIVFSSYYFTSHCGIGCSLFINNNRNVYSMGLNVSGKLGFNENEQVIDIPKQIPLLNNIKMLGICDHTSICLDFDGYVFTFGRNLKGELGIGKTYEDLPFTHIPQKILDIPFIEKISCGFNTVACLDSNGFVYVHGYGDKGQIGNGTNDTFYKPEKNPFLSSISNIEFGGNFIFAFTTNREVYSWGENEFGQLAHNTTENCNYPKLTCNFPSDYVSVKCGLDYILILTSKGKVYSCGDGEYGQLGIPNSIKLLIPTLIPNLPLIHKIGVGFDYCMCIDLDNNLWVFGSNEFGQLGLKDTVDRFTPIKNPYLSNVSDMAHKGETMFIKTYDNKIYGCGPNLHNQLGIKTKKQNIKKPKQLFEGNENIWNVNIFNSRAKSARK